MSEAQPLSSLKLSQIAKAVQAPCPPPPPGCVFVGIFIDAEGNCWCVYSCETGVLLVPCP